MFKLIIFVILHSFHISDNSKLDNFESLKLSILIHKYSLIHKIPVKVYLSLLGVESRFDVGAYNARTKDYGISQINIKTIKRYNLDKNRLLVDAEYGIDKGALILGDFKKRYGSKLKKEWFVKYNCGTKKRCEKRKYAKRYKQKIYANINKLDMITKM